MQGFHIFVIVKTALIYLAIVAIAITASSRLVVFATWSLHQDYIIAQYCVNKAQPEILCSGRCYLNDQLVNVDDDLSTTSDLNHKVTLQPWSFDRQPALDDLASTEVSDLHHTWSYQDESGRLYKLDLPDPPRV